MAHKLLAFTCSLLCMTTALTARAQTEDSILEFMPAIMSAAGNSIPRPINFKVARPRLGVANEYLIELNTADWNIPVNAAYTAAIALTTTDELQEAIDWAKDEGYNRVVFPNGRFLIGKYGNSIYQAGINLHSETEYILSPGTVIEMYKNDKWNYCVLSANGATDVIIRGGNIKGDRAYHTFTPRSNGGSTAHDEGHAICVWGSERVLVRDMNIHSVTGDGSLLLNSKDVRYSNNNIYNNRRQGISVVGGVRVEIDKNEIHHIRGTPPQFGIDVEGAGREDRDIVIRRNNFHHNRGGDIVNTSGKNVFIIHNVMHQGTAGSENRYIDGPIVTWENTDNVIARNTITMIDRSVNGRLGYIQYSGGNDRNPKTTYVHDNVCYDCGMYMYRAEGADIRRNKFYGYFIALSYFSNAVLVDNLVTFREDGPRYCWTYRFNQAYGFASGNKVEENEVTIPLSTTRPHTLDCVVRGF